MFARLIQRMGLMPFPAKNLTEARKILCEKTVHLVILDRILGKGQDGLRLCLEMKKNLKKRLIPVIVITGAMGGFQEQIKGYKYGADLYLQKPVDCRKLSQYISTFLNRLPYRGEQDKIAYKNIALDAATHTVRINGSIRQNLTERQFNFLALLVLHQGGVLPRRYLLSKLWKTRVLDKELDVLVCRLRRRLKEENSSSIISIRSLGYCIKA